MNALTATPTVCWLRSKGGCSGFGLVLRWTRATAARLNRNTSPEVDSGVKRNSNKNCIMYCLLEQLKKIKQF